MAELSCIYCGRAAKSPSEHAEPERDLSHRPGVLEELGGTDDVAHRRLMHGARIAFASLRAGRAITRGRRSR